MTITLHGFDTTVADRHNVLRLSVAACEGLLCSRQHKFVETLTAKTALLVELLRIMCLTLQNDSYTTGADAPSRSRALASAGVAGNHRGSLVQQVY